MDDGVDRRDLTPEQLAEARCYALSIEWSPEDDAFVVSVPDLPKVHTHGATRQEAAEMGDEVVAIWLTATREAGLPTPPPTFNAKRVVVERPSAYDAARIREIRRGLDVSQRVFADMLNVSLATVYSWEQGVRTPDGASVRLLSIAERRPEVLIQTVSSAIEKLDRRTARRR